MEQKNNFLFRAFLNSLPDNLKEALKGGISEYSGLNTQIPVGYSELDPMFKRSVTTLIPDVKNRDVTDRTIDVFTKNLSIAALKKSIGSRMFIHPFHILDMISLTGVVKFELNTWIKSLQLYESALPQAVRNFRTALETKDVIGILNSIQKVGRETSWIWSAVKKDTGWVYEAYDPKKFTEGKLLDYYIAEMYSTPKCEFGVDPITVYWWIKRAGDALKLTDDYKKMRWMAPNLIVPNDDMSYDDLEDISQLKDASEAMKSEVPTWTKWADENKVWTAIFGKYTYITTRWTNKATSLGDANTDLDKIDVSAPNHLILDRPRYTLLDADFLFNYGYMANDREGFIGQMSAQSLKSLIDAAWKYYYTLCLMPMMAETDQEKDALNEYYAYIVSQIKTGTPEFIDLEHERHSTDEFLKYMAEKGDPLANWESIPNILKEKGGFFDDLKKMVLSNKAALLDTAVSAASAVLPYGQWISTGYNVAKKAGMFDSLTKKTEIKADKPVHPNALITESAKFAVAPKNVSTDKGDSTLLKLAEMLSALYSASDKTSDAEADETVDNEIKE